MVVEAEHERGYRSEHEDEAGDNARPVAPVTTHGGIEQVGGGHPHQCFGQEDGKGIQTKDAHGKRHQPEGCRRLVHGDGVPRVQGPQRKAFQLTEPAWAAAE